MILSQDPNLAQDWSPQYGFGTRTIGNQPVILDFNNPSYLDVNQSYTQTVNVPLPTSAQGTWYVYVVPDGVTSDYLFTPSPSQCRS